MNTQYQYLVRRVGLALAVLLAVGAVGLLGYQIGVRSLLAIDAAGHDGQIWTCAMHPQIKLPSQGKCPICFMDLTLAKNTQQGPPRELTLSPEAVALADIRTEKVVAQPATHTVRMVGKIDFSESRLAYITARTPGRLERLFVDYTGVAVREGDHLVELFSPTLTVAQHELLQAVRGGGRQPDEISSAAIRRAEEKLRLLGLVPKQIEEIKKSGQPTDRITIHAPIGGVVVRKEATEGMYVETGSKIYTIADLTEVWALLDAYESDLPWVRYGQEVEFNTDSNPGTVFKGRVSFVDPVLNEASRTVRVRVNVPNRDGKLKPGMFVRATVQSQITQEGRVVDPAMAGKWISPMHPEIVKDAPGKCDVCGMDLVPAEQMGYVTAKSADPPLLIPASAPLVTGKRAIVYVKLPHKGVDAEHRADPKFEGREILLGPRAGDFYIVRGGLEPGEEVVTSGAFKLDADLQIQGRPSMMNPPATETPILVRLSVPDSFRSSLTPVYDAYLGLHKALAGDMAAEATARTQALRKAIEAMDAKSLDAPVRDAWAKHQKLLIDALSAVDSKTSTTDLRKKFEPVSLAMIDLVEAFGHARSDALYKAYCPMAFERADGKERGASWLQASEKIENPYRTDMPRCGTIEHPFKPAAANR